jgi:hypothetical protein
MDYPQFMMYILNLIIIGRTLTWLGYALPALNFINLTFVLQQNIYEPAPGWFGHVHRFWHCLPGFKEGSEISIAYKALYLTFIVWTLTSLIPVIYYIWAFKTPPSNADYP